MIIMGIRNMRPYKYLPIQLPYCVFEVSKKGGEMYSLVLAFGPWSSSFRLVILGLPLRQFMQKTVLFGVYFFRLVCRWLRSCKASMTLFIPPSLP